MSRHRVAALNRCRDLRGDVSVVAMVTSASGRARWSTSTTPVGRPKRVSAHDTSKAESSAPHRGRPEVRAHERTVRQSYRRSSLSVNWLAVTLTLAAVGAVAPATYLKVRRMDHPRRLRL
jgi:hypothetical protein